MSNVAIIVLADTDTHEGLGRAVNGYKPSKNSRRAGRRAADIRRRRAEMDSGIRKTRPHGPRVICCREGSDQRRL